MILMGSNVWEVLLLHTLLSDSAAKRNLAGMVLNWSYAAFELSKKYKFGKDEKMRVMMMLTSYHLLTVVPC